jgi:hypothetical protein
MLTRFLAWLGRWCVPADAVAASGTVNASIVSPAVKHLQRVLAGR